MRISDTKHPLPIEPTAKAASRLGHTIKAVFTGLCLSGIVVFTLIVSLAVDPAIYPQLSSFILGGILGTVLAYISIQVPPNPWKTGGITHWNSWHNQRRLWNTHAVVQIGVTVLFSLVLFMSGQDAHLGFQSPWLHAIGFDESFPVLLRLTLFAAALALFCEGARVFEYGWFETSSRFWRVIGISSAIVHIFWAVVFTVLLNHTYFILGAALGRYGSILVMRRRPIYGYRAIRFTVFLMALFLFLLAAPM